MKRIIRISAVVLLHLLSSLIASANIKITVTPVSVGHQLIRASIPFPDGFLLKGQTLKVRMNDSAWKSVGLRALSFFPGEGDGIKAVRRGMITFLYEFENLEPVELELMAVDEEDSMLEDLPVSVSTKGDSIALLWRNGSEVWLRAIAPDLEQTVVPEKEIIEDNMFFRHVRFHYSDKKWPRILEIKLDAVGRAVVVLHIQRNDSNDGFAPNLGWEAKLNTKTDPGSLIQADSSYAENTIHDFRNGNQFLWKSSAERFVIYHPSAHLKRIGQIKTDNSSDKTVYRYLRCSSNDSVPMQPMAWRRIEIVISPPGRDILLPSLKSAHKVISSPELWKELYGIERDVREIVPGSLRELVDFHRATIKRSALTGHDWGNVTADISGRAAIFGMNRINHCIPIFKEGWRSGDSELLETAILWCDNFYDQSIWWGKKERGGTRYNNIIAMQQNPLTKDYMWRSNSSVDFCTKGFSAFWLAWEETGDPRMKEALDTQVSYAKQYLDLFPETRNIGCVNDFVNLYKFTGEKHFLDEGLRLFRELQKVLTPGYLFDQGGKPVTPDTVFIDDDQNGSKVGFVKPYLLGYALTGLPELARLSPEVTDVVRAAADFMIKSQDPLGGWRYPHPRSSYLSLGQAIEHAWQLTRAGSLLGPEEQLLDALESVLRQRIQVWSRSGKILSGIGSWEMETGIIRNQKEMYDLYKRPEDRNFQKDYSEGSLIFFNFPPDSIVYFSEVLDYYLKYRPLSSLFSGAELTGSLGRLLQRFP